MDIMNLNAKRNAIVRKRLITDAFLPAANLTALERIADAAHLVIPARLVIPAHPTHPTRPAHRPTVIRPALRPSITAATIAAAKY